MAEIRSLITISNSNKRLRVDYLDRRFWRLVPSVMIDRGL